MHFDLIKIFREMDVFARAVVGTLVLMAVAASAVLIERLWVYARARRRSRAFGREAADLLGRGDHSRLCELAERARGTPLAALVAAGLRVYLSRLGRPGALSAVELARREMERRTESLVAEIRRGLSVLASVGSVAPFVGLLGTVVGIIAAFQGIAKEGSGGLGAVSAGIAEALVVTALGLLVAIPAVLAFNFVSVRADALVRRLDEARGELLDHLESGGGSVRLEAATATPDGIGAVASHGPAMTAPGELPREASLHA
jgi:biopolymer transport protein ExbB